MHGVSLTELLVSIAVGSVLLLGITTTYATLVQRNAQQLAATRLNQELRGAMNVMVSEIRRAGFCGLPTGCAGNPFTTGTDNLQFGDAAGATSGSCVTFTFDRLVGGIGGTVQPIERRGFRFRSAAITGSAGDIQIRTGGPPPLSCAAGSWEALSDNATVDIVNASFQYQNDTDAAAEAPICVDTNGPQSKLIRNVQISLTGRLIDAPAQVSTLTEVVRVQNDAVQNFNCPAPGG